MAICCQWRHEDETHNTVPTFRQPFFVIDLKVFYKYCWQDQSHPGHHPISKTVIKPKPFWLSRQCTAPQMTLLPICYSLVGPTFAPIKVYSNTPLSQTLFFYHISIVIKIVIKSQWRATETKICSTDFTGAGADAEHVRYYVSQIKQSVSWIPIHFRRYSTPHCPWPFVPREGLITL